MIAVDEFGGRFGIAVLSAVMWISCLGSIVEAQPVPSYYFDPGWPNPLPNQWKLGGITGLAVDDSDNVWVLNRPGDLSDMELYAELADAIAECCARPPAVIRLDKAGSVIGSFDAAEGHGMDVDEEGFVYIGQPGAPLEDRPRPSLETIVTRF